MMLATRKEQKQKLRAVVDQHRHHDIMEELNKGDKCDKRARARFLHKPFQPFKVYEEE